MKLKPLFLFALFYFFLILIIYAGWANTQNEHGAVAKIFKGLMTFFSYPLIVLRDSFGVKMNTFFLTINYIIVSFILAVLTEKIRWINYKSHNRI
ncbi:hypothetical protein CBW18_21065 [Pedobacter sp. AJM]|nr:hypothetical protein CBW18_21065 [Pedobacter sp. AJM]